MKMASLVFENETDGILFLKGVSTKSVVQTKVQRFVALDKCQESLYLEHTCSFLENRTREREIKELGCHLC